MRKLQKISFRYQLMALFLFSFALYWRATAEWTSDELVFLSKVPAGFDVWQYFDPTWGWYYRPLYLAYFAIMRQLSGDNPLWMMDVNLVCHALSAVLVSVLAFRLKVKMPILCGGMFVALTYNNEAIRWISSITTLWAMLGILGALLSWLSYVESGKKSAYFCAIFCTIFAFLSKEESAALPFLIVVLDVWKRPRVSFENRLLVLAPFFALLVPYLYLSMVAHGYSKFFQSTVKPDPFTIFPLLQESLGGYFDNLGLFGGLICLGALIFLSMRSPITRVQLVWLIAALAPVPLALGKYALDHSRFWYVSCAFSALLLLSLYELTEDIRLQNRVGWTATKYAAFATFLVPFATQYVNRQDGDMVTIALLMVTFAGTLVAWRSKLVSPDILALIVIVATASQLDLSIYRTVELWQNWFSLLAVVGIVLYSIRATGYQWWQAAWTATLLFIYPPVTLPIFLLSQLASSEKFSRRAVAQKVFSRVR